VANAEEVLRDESLDLGIERQQPERIRDRGPALPTRSAAVSCVRSKSLHEAGEPKRLLDRVQPLPLKVLDEPD
jgi:hypothetical protein